MTTPDTPERNLRRDLGGLGARLGDDGLMRDLHASLSGRTVSKDDDQLSLDRDGAEDLLNTVRAEHGLPPVGDLAGGRPGDDLPGGRPGDDVLTELGWSRE